MKTRLLFVSLFHRGSDAASGHVLQSITIHNLYHFSSAVSVPREKYEKVDGNARGVEGNITGWTEGASDQHATFTVSAGAVFGLRLT